MQHSTRQKTKAALIQSAERLFAEKGLGSVSVKEITRAAGAKNPSAVHYHFGNVESLVKEVFAKRYAAIETERLDRLAKIKVTQPKKRLVALMQAALGPFMETCLEEEGRLYVRFCVQLFTDPRFEPAEILAQSGNQSIGQLRAEIVDCVKDTVPEETLARRLPQGLMISLILADDFARRIEAGTAPSAEQAVKEAAVSVSAYFSAKMT